MRDEDRIGKNKQIFDRELTVYYDRMIRWEKRLAFEGPLFEALWKRFGTRSVLDAACGSGAHLELFRAQGLEIAGSDGSAGMLELSRARLGKTGPAPMLTLASWDELPQKIEKTFDAVLCLGNSLPYVTERDALARSLEGMWSRVTVDGFLLIQYKNFGMLRARGERFLPVSGHRDAGGAETVAIRQYDWLDGAVDFLAVIVERENAAAEWRMRNWTTKLATWPPEIVKGELERLGAKVQLCGSVGLEPFEAEKSDDAVFLAEKQG